MGDGVPKTHSLTFCSASIDCPTETHDGAKKETETGAVGDGSPRTPLSSMDEGMAKWIARESGPRAEGTAVSGEASTW